MLGPLDNVLFGSNVRLHVVNEDRNSVLTLRRKISSIFADICLIIETNRQDNLVYNRFISPITGVADKQLALNQYLRELPLPTCDGQTSSY